MSNYHLLRYDFIHGGCYLNKKNWCIILVLVVLSLVWRSPGSAATTGLSDIKHEIIFSIPVGDNGIHYASDGADMLIWGPPAITIAPDGSFWIADTADNHLLRFDLNGVLINVNSG